MAVKQKQPNEADDFTQRRKVPKTPRKPQFRFAPLRELCGLAWT